MIEIATITCLVCDHQATERMPLDACVYFWPCPACGTMVRPLQGKCCVFCSYGSSPCPPCQLAGRTDRPARAAAGRPRASQGSGARRQPWGAGGCLFYIAPLDIAFSTA
jgi:hypothetical protein